MLPTLAASGRRSLLPALLAVALWPSVGQAQSGDPLVEAREARHWLARIHAATEQYNFQGIFVVSAGGTVASSRIAHYCEGRNQFERIESLDGLKRQVYRHNEVVHSFWPHRRLAVIETRQAMSQFPALLPDGAERIVQHYDVKSLGAGRVAGHDANVLLLQPKDGYRFGYRLWAEKATGLLLRAEVFDEREVVLEASAFSELMLNVKPRADLVLQAMKRLDGYRVQRLALQETELAREGWVLKQPPPGFRPVSSVRRLMAAFDADPPPAGPSSGADAAGAAVQAIFSDGLTHVSIFIEPFDAAVHRREVLMAVGATQTLVKRKGDWWVTVIGDVPVITLRAFAASLEPRR